MQGDHTSLSPNGKTILLADDEPEVRGFLETALRCQGYRVESVQDGEEALDSLRRAPDEFSAVLLDVLMPRKNGLDTLREIRQFDDQLPVILLSCASSAPDVVEAMKSGATDFLAKPITHDHLGHAITKALSRGRTHEPAKNTPANGAQAFCSLPVREIESLLHNIAASDVPVLIQGETGVGKEVIARRIHTLSTRAEEPFLKLNCAALPSELVESELFGYERGAFTGAFQRKPGIFEMADGGTILLDEIGDMNYRLQAKLLQVLQDHEFQRLGGKEIVRVDVRVIAATHWNLKTAIKLKRFREDLYYRLNVVSIQIPPLRERKQEIVPLAEFLMRKHSMADSPPRLSSELQRLFLEYEWPGNIRELENMIRRFLVIGRPDMIIEELRQDILSRELASKPLKNQHSAAPRTTAYVPAQISILEEVNQARMNAEREAILQALDSTHWNRKQAAGLLNIDYKALLYKMKKLRIEDGQMSDLVPLSRRVAAGSHG